MSSKSLGSTMKELVDLWVALDQNLTTRAEVQALWEARDSDQGREELERRMRNRIEFGTAGLRGRMEAGWARMNDLIIIQASQGLRDYVLQSLPSAADRGVVIGHDHRHNSAKWALLSAAAFIEKGVKVYLHRGLVHTPLVPFSVRKLGAACGVMITASHNPKNDNGYKVYWENAVQIIAPHDQGISDAIKVAAKVGPSARIWDTENVLASPECLDVTEKMKEAYFECLGGLHTRSPPKTNQNVPLKIVNTSMHGVGNPFVSRALSALGDALSITPVQEQMHPDPEFPTVPFPNPEEKGALDLAIAAAEKHGANYVLAQDPDADRFAAVEIDSAGHTVFTGDQLGTIFAAYTFETYRASGKPLDKLAMVASTVSSKMIEAMAKMEGFRSVECLTGFKYIGNTALDLVGEDYEVPFGYEEAIGFMFGDEIRDKDGVAASVMFAQLALMLRSREMTVKGYLDELYARYGYFKTSNSYFICSDPAIIDAIFARLRYYNSRSEHATAQKSGPPSLSNYPTRIAGLSITSVIDLTLGHAYDSTNAPGYEPRLPVSGGNMVQFRAESEGGEMGIVLTIRTSGTEPKIKYYLEGSGKDVRSVEQLLPRVVEELGSEWMQAGVYGLGRP